MINQSSLPAERSRQGAPVRLGTLACLAVFLWSLGMVMLVPARGLWLAGGICLLVLSFVYPHAFRKLMRPRWLAMALILALPPIFLLGGHDRSLWGVPYSSEGLVASAQILVRILVVLVSVNGFTNAVDITCLAGLLERLGLKGLGFTLGVALNLLPALQTAALQTWHSLWMRGGLRAQRWRGLRLLLLTIITNALRRTEEIALAAEGRAFSPEQPRPMPLRAGRFDGVALAGVALLTLTLIWMV